MLRSSNMLKSEGKSDFHPLNQLFNSYCKPLYGLPLWNHCDTRSSQNFKLFESAYNSSLKQILDVPKYTCNHVTAVMLNQMLFVHYVAYVKLKYYQRISKSPMCFIRINTPHIQSGLLGTDIYSLAKKYNISVMEDQDVLKARIKWVQNHEERSRPCIYFQI